MSLREWTKFNDTTLAPKYVVLENEIFLNVSMQKQVSPGAKPVGMPGTKFKIFPERYLYTQNVRAVGKLVFKK